MLQDGRGTEPETDDGQIGSPLKVTDFVGAVVDRAFFVLSPMLPLAYSLACFRVGRASSRYRMNHHR